MTISFSQALEGYELAAYARRLSKQKLADYGNTFSKLQRFLSGDPPITAISTNQLRQFLAAQTAVASKTLLNYHTGLSALWRWAADEGLVESNIVRAIAAPRPERQAIEPYTPHDGRAMLRFSGRSPSHRQGRNSRQTNHGTDEKVVNRNGAILPLLLDTGLRASELSGGQVGDVDLRNIERMSFLAGMATMTWRRWSGS